MPNQHIVELIGKALQEGFIHPGDPTKDMPARPVILAFKPPPGAPKELADLMNASVKFIGEGIVALVEEDHEIVPRGEAVTMRRAVGEGPNGPMLVPVYCRCDKGNPLIVLTMDSPDSPIVIDGPTFLRGLGQRDTAHPHAVGPRDSEAGELRTAVLDAMESMTKRQMPVSARKIIADAMAEVMGE